MQLLNLLLGRPLATREQSEQRIGVVAGVAALGLDGLSSAAYGPEALLTVLIPLGAAQVHYVGPITGAIVGLLTILYFSYRQTIAAYPGGGGSYTVAKDNLGTTASLWAAAALMLDYILTVAVGISAGIAALVSAFPDLHRHTLLLCLVTLVLIALINLRGTVESGWAFVLPTYLFIASFAVVLGVGIGKAILGGGHAQPVVPPPALPAGTTTVSLWLLLRAFASGCTAMTGVEAVSNGVTAFRDPGVVNARRTLTVIVATLAVLLGGIAFLCRTYGIGAMDQGQPGYQSILSQLVAAVFGRGAFYYVTITNLLVVLCLSANTSFVDFPRLCRLVATDGFLPCSFALYGRRLVSSVGIVFLAGAAGLLLIGFDGITEHLIPLYAVGAFLAFTLSQAGMVCHWRRQLRKTKHGAAQAWVKLAVNGLGAAATGGALAVILAAKFREGAWVTVLAFPVILGLFNLVKRYYKQMDRQMRTRKPLDLSKNAPPVVVVPIQRWNKLVDKALRLAVEMSPDVIAVHLFAIEGTEGDDQAAKLRTQWAEDVEKPALNAGLAAPRLEIIQSPYRKFFEPLMELIGRLREQYPRRMIAVLVPEVVKTNWWQFVLHNYRGEMLRAALLRQGDHRLVVVNVPWYVEDPTPTHHGSRPASVPEGLHRPAPAQDSAPIPS
jgi:amino acid transporter